MFVLFPLALATVVMAIVLLAIAKGNEKDKRAGIVGLLIGLVPVFFDVSVCCIRFFRYGFVFSVFFTDLLIFDFCEAADARQQDKQ